MKFITAVVASVVVIGTVSAQTERAMFEDSLKTNAEILPLKKDANRSVYAVEVQLNSKPLWMVVDSTAAALTFSLEAAKIANIPLKQALVGAPGEGVQTMVGPVESFTLGKAKITSEAMPFMSYSRMGELMIDGTAHPTGGQLGVGILKSLKAAVDFSKGRLLVPAAALQGGLGGLCEAAKMPSVALLEHNQQFLVSATLQGKEVYFLCSTGARWTSLTGGAVKEMGLTLAEPKEGIPATAKVPDLKIGELQLKDATLRVMGDLGGSVAGKPVVGVLGVDLLTASKAIIAFGESRLFFDAPAQ